jgi:hypothetical protein
MENYLKRDYSGFLIFQFLYTAGVSVKEDIAAAAAAAILQVYLKVEVKTLPHLWGIN